MKFVCSLGIILTLACLQSAMAQKDLDTIWLCHDSIPEGSAGELFFKMYLADTFPDNRGQFQTVDTGNSLDGSKYVNFDYQFDHPRYLTDTVPHPGYAGFKFYWDNGVVKFFAEYHDSMFLWHKGPLPGHKVKLVWAQGGDCGGPISYQDFAEFKSSPVWKRECFPYPPNFNAHGLFELRVLIYNDTGNSPTSAPGCLKVDNMAFIKKSTGVRNSKHALEENSNVRFFIPNVSGKVTLAIFSLQGELLFKEPVNVVAGRKYNVSQFARKNSNLPASWINCVQINGPGVNITRKLVR